MKGFVLDLPDQVDEDEVVNKLVAQQDVMRVVPDTWVGIAAATGVRFLEQLLCMTHSSITMTAVSCSLFP